MAMIVRQLTDQGVDVRQEYWDDGLETRTVFVKVAGSDNLRPIERITVDADGDVIVEVPA